jgi:flagellar FliL protein
MAEADEKPAEQPEAAKTKSKLPLIASGVLVLAGAVVALWYLGVGPFAGGAARHAAATAAIAEHGGEADDEKNKAGAILALEPFIANLADDGGHRYLKATFQVDFGKTVPPTIQSRLPQVRDLLLTLFTSKTFDDIRTPEGKQQLREEIIARINQVLDRDVVKAVYFTEFIVQ